MERLVSRERELDVDLESGSTVSEEDRTNDHVCESRRHNKLFDRFGFGPSGCERSVNSCVAEEDRTNDHVCESRRHNKLFDRFGFGPSGCERSVNSCVAEEVCNGDIALLIDRKSEGEEGQHHAAVVDKRHAVDKPKTKNTKKAAKPPRPPKGPMLDAVDQKLMQEIAELAMRKRARIERFKALKKMRATRSSSWISSLTAMVITVLFCLILIFQAVFSRNNGIIDLHVSPGPAVAGGDLISVQFYDNFSTNETDKSASDSPSAVNSQVSGSASRRPS